MKKKHIPFRSRQLRTSALLALAIALLLGSGFYFRRVAAAKEVAVPVAAVSQSDINAALVRYRERTEGDMAQLVAQSPQTGTLKFALAFYGVCSEKTAETLAQLLQNADVQASFYLTSVEADSHRAMASAIQNAGFSVGVLNDGTSPDTPFVSGETSTANLSRASLTMQAAYGVQPSSMLVLADPPEDLLYAAKTADIDTVYLASKAASLQTIATEADAEALIGSVSRGGILALQLSGDAQTLDALRLLLAALQGTDLSATVQTRLDALGQSEAPDPVKVIRTTQRAVCFTFSGSGSDAELDGVLQALKGVSGKGTFFVTNEEAASNAESITRILDSGHSLGIAILPQSDTAAGLLQQLLQTEETIRTRYAYEGELCARTVSGSASQTFLQAAAAGGFPVISSGVNASQQEDMRQINAATVLARIMPETRGMLQRGEIVHFQMGLYQASQTILGDLVRGFARDYSVYPVTPLAEVLHNTEYTYTYPLPDDAILPEVKDRIYPGQLNQNNFTEMQRRYYGISWVDRASFLPGFSDREVRALDKRGVIPNNSNMVFLTFDDWGTDSTITALLDVLKRHGAKATFFVRTNFVDSNPNLLRAIALEGHAIGSHTDSHFPLSNERKNGLSYDELTPEQVPLLQEDLVTSYNKLQRIVGDITIDGKPALCRIFRPPTLAMSRKGLETLLDCGFTYSVSGSYTAQDYKATDASVLANTLLQNTRSGSVIVMHMSDISVYTAEALEIYFSRLEQRTTAPFRFVRLTDGLPDEV